MCMLCMADFQVSSCYHTQVDGDLVAGYQHVFPEVVYQILTAGGNLLCTFLCFVNDKFQQSFSFLNKNFVRTNL